MNSAKKGHRFRDRGAHKRRAAHDVPPYDQTMLVLGTSGPGKLLEDVEARDGGEAVTLAVKDAHRGDFHPRLQV